MNLPASVRKSVESVLADASGRSDRVVSVAPAHGGCIHNGVRLTTASGASFFLKWNAHAPAGIFAAEADGLRALREAAGEPDETDAGDGSPTPEALHVPEPIAWDHVPAGWLLMEYFEPAPTTPDSAAILGRALARIHGTGAGSPLGWHEPNWIGSLAQDNTPCADWGTFWRERRIVPQLSMARQRGALNEPVFDRLVDSIPDALDRVGPPALLHGDLWGGNTFTASGGVPVLIDPAVYVGDGEVDLAMTELFGGFDPAFYRAYDERRPISDAYRSHRRDLYQLYYLLVHVNLFGGSYVAASRRAAERVVAAVS